MLTNKIVRIAESIFFIVIIAAVTTLLTESIYSHGKNKSNSEFVSYNQPVFQDTTSVRKGRAVLDEFSAAFESASSRISPSVVPIFAEQVVAVNNQFGAPDDQFKEFFGEDFFKRFFGNQNPNQKETVHSLGSGVIVTSDGYILTNNHVVQGSSKLTVVLNDKKKYTAKVVGADPQTDVAVIKIDANNLPAAALGNSDRLKIGQWVIAVGNPFQLMHTVTAGIISAQGRSSVGLAEYEDFIQTDAAINPGNSGGALSDLDGRVIGINTAISSPSGGSVGIGFAIPINMAKKVMDELINKGTISRGYLALVPQDITEDLAKALKLKNTEGVIVSNVQKDGPADKAGIKTGDIILKYNGEQINSSVQLRNLVAETNPGSKASIVILRNNDQKELNVKIGERPKEVAANDQNNNNNDNNSQGSYSSDRLGVAVQNITPDIASQLHYDGKGGVVVTGVQSGSAAEEAGLNTGDVIRQVNKQDISSSKDFENDISKVKKGDPIALLVQRGNTSFYVGITAS
jgi:serine protease Do